MATFSPVTQDSQPLTWFPHSVIPLKCLGTSPYLEAKFTDSKTWSLPSLPAQGKTQKAALVSTGMLWRIEERGF